METENDKLPSAVMTTIGVITKKDPNSIGMTTIKHSDNGHHISSPQPRETLQDSHSGTPGVSHLETDSSKSSISEAPPREVEEAVIHSTSSESGSESEEILERKKTPHSSPISGGRRSRDSSQSGCDAPPSPPTSPPPWGDFIFGWSLTYGY